MSHPEGVQLGPDAQALLGSHPAVLCSLDTLGIGMVGEQPDATTSNRFGGIGKVVVRRGHGPTRLARIVRGTSEQLPRTPRSRPEAVRASARARRVGE